MLYLDTIICVLSILAALYFALKNLFRKPFFAVNALFMIIALIATGMLGSLLYLLLRPDSTGAAPPAVLYLAAILLIMQLHLHLAQIYPRWEKRTPLWLILVSAIPGAVAYGLTLATDLIVSGSALNESGISLSYGSYFPLYTGVLIFYMLGTFVTLLVKTRRLANESFRMQLVYLALGDLACFLLVAASLAVLPYYFNMREGHSLGIPAAVITLLFINNFAISGQRLLDFRRFYWRSAYRLTVFTILFLPAFLLLRYAGEIGPAGQGLPSAALAVAVFLYFFLFFRYLTPRIDRLFRARYLQFEQMVNEFFQGITSLSDLKEQGVFWDQFFNNTIDALEPRFNISSASFYMYSARDNAYLYSYGYGEGITIRSIDGNGDIIRCVQKNPGLLELSMLFTEEALREFREAGLRFFSENHVYVMLPFYNHERQLIGLLLLGRLKDGRPYQIDLISALEIYRIHFEVSLANSIYLDEIAATQVAEHDRMVVNTIKKRIIPSRLRQVEGVRISSIFLNNSEYGGDYFDSIAVDPDRLGVFITDTSNAGVDSAVLALELYTVFHTQHASHDSPERFLNVMNWVIASSRFSDTYAPAFYAIISPQTRTLSYSNAAMKPMVLFDPSRESFTELDTNGIPLGIDKGFSYESKIVQLPAGSIGFLYSDGLESALNKQGASYSTGRVKDIIRLNKDDTPAVLIRKIFTDFKNFTGDTKLLNDVSLIIFRSY